MKIENIIQLTFKLTEKQIGNYPISTETIWCEIVGENYRVKNIPLFIDEISYDDLISIKNLGDNMFSISKIESPSGNSTIWVFLHDLTAGEIIIESLKKLGCSIEGGSIKKYFAINVPSDIEIQNVYDLLDGGEEIGILDIDYPSIRHS